MAAFAPNHNYLANEVLTAPPQKLRLMLIEAAIRYITRARAAWANGQSEEGGELILRAQDVVGELLGALKPDAQSELVRNVAALYVFVFRALVDAHVRRDAARLEDALRVLNVEAETWRMVCRQLAESQAEASPQSRTQTREADVHAAASSAGPPAPQGIPIPAPHAVAEKPSPRHQPHADYERPAASGFSITG